MSQFVLTNCTVLIGSAWTGTAPGDPGNQTVSGTITSSTDISAMLSSVEVALSQDIVEYTNFASGGWKQKMGSLKEGTFQFNFNQDFGASKIDALFGLGGSVIPLFGTGTYYVDVKPTSSARGATNPSYVFQVVPVQYTPLTGPVGALAAGQIQFPTTGQVARLVA